MNTKKIGNLTELQCATALYELGCAISIPFGNSEKYDLIMDYKNKLYKIQCKHSHEIRNEEEVASIGFKTTWQSRNSKGWEINKYNDDEVDYFATYYNNQCYLIPSNECLNFKYLRITDTKNNQSKRISYLKDYEAQKILNQL